MKKFELSRIYGEDHKHDIEARFWLVMTGLGFIADGLVMLGSATFLQTNLSQMGSLRFARQAYIKENRRLAKDSVSIAFQKGVQAYKEDLHEFQNPYFNVPGDLEDAWDRGFDLERMRHGVSGEGAKAFRDGVLPSANPYYGIDSKSSQEWFDGYEHQSYCVDEE